MALPKKFRFTSKAEINSLFSNAKRRTSPLFTLLLRNNTNNGLRLAVLVTKKVDKRSTQRNILKRKFNEIFQLLIQKRAPKPAEIVIIPKKKAIRESKEKIETEIKNMLIKEGVIRA